MPLIIRPSNPNNNQRQHCRWHGYPTAALLEQAAVQTILEAAELAISKRKEFHLVLAGGTTPRHVYELLRNQITDWRKWHIYFGDERCLPVNDAERNSMMAAQALLNHVAIPVGQIHIIPAEQGAEAAAAAYSLIMDTVEKFDLVLLGLGEDGHTASLFPEHDWGTSPGSSSALVVNNAPKPPSERVSLSAQRLSQCRKLMFLVTGINKRKAIQDWRNGIDIPAAAIKPENGVDILMEETLL